MAEIRIAGQWPNPELSADYTHGPPHPTLMLMQPLPLWGTRGAAMEVAKGEAGLVGLDVEAAERKLRHDVRIHYYGLLYVLRAEEIGQQDLESKKQLLDIALARYEADDVAELDVKQTRLDVERSQAAHAALRAAVATARADLNLDLGRAWDAEIELAGKLDDRPALPDREAVTRAALAEGLAARAVRQSRATEVARLRLAGKGRFPEVSAGIGVELDDPELSTVPQWGLTVTLPLWNRQGGARARATANLDRIALEQQALEARLPATLAAAMARIEETDRQVGLHATSLLPAAKELRELYADGYRQGAMGLVAVLEAEKGVQELALAYAKALLDLHTAIADLEVEAGVELDP